MVCSSAPHDKQLQRRLTMGRLRLLLASCAILLSGCWPYRYTTHPGIVGTVVSAENGVPVAAADVTLIAPLWRQTERRLIAKTGADGRFEIAPQRQWGMFVLMQEAFRPVECAVEIAAPMYTLENLPLPCSEYGPVMTDLSTISLRRALPPPPPASQIEDATHHRASEGK
jgi:hypothetical protein